MKEILVNPLRVFLLIMTALLLLQACDPYGQDEFEEQMVVEAFLTAGRNLPEVQLTRTLPFNRAYSRSEAALSGMHVRIILLETNGEPALVFNLSEISNGIYRYQTESHVVRAGRRYRLEVRESAGDEEPVLRATTFVPGAFDLVSDNGSAFIYQGPEQYEPTFTRSQYPGRQTYYVASVRASEPEPDQLTPFYADQYDEDNPREYDRISSGIINEENYEQNEDGTITLKLPWIAIAYYGLNEVSVFAIDTNIYDYIRTLGIQQGGSTLSPGQIENVIWNVEGGIGIFGSRSGIEATILVEPGF